MVVTVGAQHRAWACLPAPRTGSLPRVPNFLLQINPELEI